MNHEDRKKILDNIDRLKSQTSYQRLMELCLTHEIITERMKFNIEVCILAI